MASAHLYWTGRVRDRCLDDTDETLDTYHNGWIEFNPDHHGFAIFYYEKGEGQFQHLIKCNRIKPIRKKPKDKYFSFKYTMGTYFEETEEPIYELTYHGSRKETMSFRECVKDKCLELPIEGRYPKRNNSDPERRPDAVVIRYCDICRVHCTVIELWEAHIAGKEHRRNRSKARFGAKIYSKAPPPLYHCDICHVDCIGEDPWESHLNGAPHLRRWKRAKGIIPKTSLPNPGEFHCDICDVDAFDQEHLDIHLNGKPHKKKVARAMYSERNQNYPRANSELSDYSDATHMRNLKTVEAKMKKLKVVKEDATTSELDSNEILEEDSAYGSGRPNNSTSSSSSSLTPHTMTRLTMSGDVACLVGHPTTTTVNGTRLLSCM